MATGSNPKIWKLLETLGHQVIPPVPSLFTFNIKDAVGCKTFPGVVAFRCPRFCGEQYGLESEGPLLSNARWT